jgi:CheY-like chemotaxis protein
MEPEGQPRHRDGVAELRPGKQDRSRCRRATRLPQEPGEASRALAWRRMFRRNDEPAVYSVGAFAAVSRAGATGVGMLAIMAFASCPWMSLEAAMNNDHCFSCTRFVAPGAGAAFQYGSILHITCYLHDRPDAKRTNDPGVSENQRLVGIHVLIAEDHEGTLEVLKAALEYSGAFVTTAGDADAVSALLQNIRPHVVLSDISMPFNGFQVARQVHAFGAETGVAIPMVAITSSRNGRQQLRDAGFAAFIAKPLDPFLLTAVVEKVAADHRGAQPHEGPFPVGGRTP